MDNVKGKVLSKVITLVNVYAPNCDDVNFFQSLFLKLSEVEGEYNFTRLFHHTHAIDSQG